MVLYDMTSPNTTCPSLKSKADLGFSVLLYHTWIRICHFSLLCIWNIIWGICTIQPLDFLVSFQGRHTSCSDRSSEKPTRISLSLCAGRRRCQHVKRRPHPRHRFRWRPHHHHRRHRLDVGGSQQWAVCRPPARRCLVGQEVHPLGLGQSPCWANL